MWEKAVIQLIQNALDRGVTTGDLYTFTELYKGFSVMDEDFFSEHMEFCGSLTAAIFVGGLTLLKDDAFADSIRCALHGETSVTPVLLRFEEWYKDKIVGLSHREFEVYETVHEVVMTALEDSRREFGEIDVRVKEAAGMLDVEVDQLTKVLEKTDLI